MSSQLHTMDERFMAACLRHARRHRGQTGTNPSVGTLLVKDDGTVVGRGITSKGGRPHAEPNALKQAGDLAKGTTAYVSLEPCAHHGVTPPCALTLINAGVKRVVTAWTDPDSRVDGKGHAMLRDAGIDVKTGVLGAVAASDLAGYLKRKQSNRPHVVLKLAVSRDGMLGRAGQEVVITRTLARSYVHRMRAEHDAILVGRGTVSVDDPDLTCRLNGLEDRSPHRFVMDTNAALSEHSQLVQSAGTVPVSLITSSRQLPEHLQGHKVGLFIAEQHEGQLALPEVLEDMASIGISSLMVEGGATVANSFLDANLVDEIALFTGDVTIGTGGLASPCTQEKMPKGFILDRTLKLADDRLDIFHRAR